MQLNMKVYILVLVCILILPSTQRSVQAQVQPRQYPFMVFLYVHNGKDSSCGGTLIDRGRILTAAHCLQGAQNLTVLLGNDINNAKMCPLLYELHRPKFIIHQDYDPSTLDNDIALIYLDGDEPIYNANVNLTSLPHEENMAGNGDTSSVVLGWSLTATNLNDKLLVKNVNIVDMSECNHVEQLERDYNKICTVEAGGLKLCPGDSGGPLLSGNIQIGILSSGLEHCTGPYVHTRVDSYMGWIEDHVIMSEKLSGGSQPKYRQAYNLIIILMTVMIMFY